MNEKSYDKFIFSYDKQKLLCQLTLYLVHEDIWTYSLFPLPLCITNRIFDNVESELDRLCEKFNEVGYDDFVQFSSLIEKEVQKECGKYSFFALPNYLHNYGSVDIDEYEEWKHTFFTKDNIQNLIVSNKFFYFKEFLNQDIKFLSILLSVIFLENYEINLVQVDESNLFKLIKDEYEAEYYFEFTSNNKITLFAPDLNIDSPNFNDNKDYSFMIFLGLDEYRDVKFIFLAEFQENDEDFIEIKEKLPQFLRMNIDTSY